MIKIIQIKKIKNVSIYVLYVDDEKICSFSHSRKNGLHDCLEKAAEAAKRVRYKKYYELVKNL